MNTEYRPYLRPLSVNAYAVIIASGKAGRITNKYRDGRVTTWGISWDSEYQSNELCRITPDEYHAMHESRKITSYETATSPVTA